MNFERMLRYLTALEQNNNRTWFHDPANHQLYTDARQDFIELVEELKFRIADVCAPELAERLIFVDPKALLYRIPRDMRTNKGKLPYNPRWAAELSAGRHTPLPIGYYVHIQPGGQSLFGTGVWCWDGDVLHNMRRAIAEDYERLEELLADCDYPLFGDRLKRVPQGYDPGHPAAEYLKLKSWLVSRSYADHELRDFDSFLDSAVAAVENMEPLRCFFNDALAGRRRNPFDVHDWD